MKSPLQRKLTVRQRENMTLRKKWRRKLITESLRLGVKAQ